MSAMASQITSPTIVCTNVYSDADQRKHQSSASLAFVRGIHRWPLNSLHKWPATRKMFSFDDVIMQPGDVTGVAPTHDDLITWKYYPQCWSFAREIHRLSVDSPDRGPVMWSFDVSILLAWANSPMGFHSRRSDAHVASLLCNLAVDDESDKYIHDALMT